MKIIQQDFKISSKIWFIIFLVSTLGMIYIHVIEDYVNLSRIIYNLFTGIILISLFSYLTYIASFLSEFKQKEIIVAPLFGLFGKQTYLFKDLKKVEYSYSNRKNLDMINLYFENNNYKKKVSISMIQVDPSKVKLFLYAHIDNLEDISFETYRRFT